MFMVCSSGGLGYNTGTWENRFRVAPIPYKSADKKYVISQGANICMTKAGDADSNFKVIKALTTGKYQTRWAIETGYFPASNSAADTSEYQAFLNDTSYADKDHVAYREGARVNELEYRAKGWNRFVDDAFIGSAKVRTQVGYILANVFASVSDLNDTNGYKTQIKTVLTDPLIQNEPCIVVDISY
jgi:ABC-type glycerol-3-phosphate transport system substrate-binding protein